MGGGSGDACRRDSAGSSMAGSLWVAAASSSPRANASLSDVPALACGRLFQFLRVTLMHAGICCRGPVVLGSGERLNACLAFPRRMQPEKTGSEQVEQLHVGGRQIWHLQDPSITLLQGTDPPAA